MTRDATIQVRLTSDDKAQIERLAAAADQSVTEYVIACALGGGPTEHDARLLLGQQVVSSVADARDHARAVKRLLSYCEAGGIDPEGRADGDGDVFAQACVLATMGEW